MSKIGAIPTNLSEVRITVLLYSFCVTTDIVYHKPEKKSTFLEASSSNIEYLDAASGRLL
jgi:hypothetical protein